MIGITVVVLSRNEEANIGRTLGALRWAKEILLVDSGSTDRTIELARSAHPNVRVIHHEFVSHPDQWNFGLDQITTEWALTLDSDYELSPELSAEIQALTPTADQSGFWVEFEYRIHGHRLRGSSYPPRIVLFKPANARYVDDGHTQTLWIRDSVSGELRPPETGGGRTEDGGQSVGKTPNIEHRTLNAEFSDNNTHDAQIGKLAGKIYHDDRKPLGRWIQDQGRYARLEARHLLGKPMEQLSLQDQLRRRIFFAPPIMFLYLLFVRGLILDGWPGWFYVGQRTIAELLLSMRLLIETKKLEDGQ